MRDAVAELSRVDILVNNAGIIRRADTLEFTGRDWDDVADVNLRAVFFLSQAAATQMLTHGGGGKIINIASMLSFQGGIVGLKRLLANEWAVRAIIVNAIAPGDFVTGNTVALPATATSSSASPPGAGASPRNWPVRPSF